MPLAVDGFDLDFGELRAESRANKDTWPVMLRIYTESLFTEKEVA